MRPASKFATLACALTTGGLFAIADPGRAEAQEPFTLARSARGGALVGTARHRFEVFFYATGLRAFPMDASGTPLDASRLSGTATFYHPNSPQPWFVRPLSPATPGPGQASPSLDLVLDLSTVPPSGARVAFLIAGLADPAETSAVFTVPVEFVTTSQPIAANPAASAAPRYVYGPSYSSPGYYYYYYPRPVYRPATRAGWVRFGHGGGRVDDAPGPDDEVRRGAPGLGPSDTGPGGASARSEDRERAEYQASRSVYIYSVPAWSSGYPYPTSIPGARR